MAYEISGIHVVSTAMVLVTLPFAVLAWAYACCKVFLAKLIHHIITHPLIFVR